MAPFVLRYKITQVKGLREMPKATQQGLEKALSRPDLNRLQEQILEIVKTADQPTTAEVILTSLKEKEQFNIYMSDISRAIWRMVSAGLIAVESGKIHTLHQQKAQEAGAKQLGVGGGELNECRVPGNLTQSNLPRAALKNDSKRF